MSKIISKSTLVSDPEFDLGDQVKGKVVTSEKVKMPASTNSSCKRVHNGHRAPEVCPCVSGTFT